MVMLVVMVMVVSVTAAAGVAAMSLPESVEEENEEEGNPNPVHDGEVVGAVGSFREISRHGEPVLWQQVVNTKAEEDSADDDGKDVEP